MLQIGNQNVSPDDAAMDASASEFWSGMAFAIKPAISQPLQLKKEIEEPSDVLFRHLLNEK